MTINIRLLNLLMNSKDYDVSKLIRKYIFSCMIIRDRLLSN